MKNNITASEDYNVTDIVQLIHVNTSESSVIIPIVDDIILELDEIFQAEIGLQNSEDRNCVILQPKMVNITIMDDDSELCRMKISIQYKIIILYYSCCNWVTT